MQAGKKILLVDLDDLRRDTRVEMLTNAGYEVDLRADYIAAEVRDHEEQYDLFIIALHRGPEEATAYSERLNEAMPRLPILLVTARGVFVPRGALSPSIEAGNPVALMREIAEMLTGSTHVRET
jgi:DNA-binding NtrC family response regulator